MATSRPMPGVLRSSGKINTSHSKCQLKFTVDLCIFSAVIVSQAEYLAKLFPVLPVLPVPGASSCHGESLGSWAPAQVSRGWQTMRRTPRTLDDTSTSCHILPHLGICCMQVHTHACTGSWDHISWDSMWKQWKPVLISRDW